MVKVKTCVFISGQGSNLKNLISYSRDNVFPIKISLVICNNKDAFGIKYAKKYNIPYIFINSKLPNSENKILLNLKRYNISFICLAGYMKIISKKIIKIFQGKILNIHPSLLPKYKGLNTFSRMLKNKEKKKAGCTVHFVNEKLDNGKIIVKKNFFISENDNEIILKKKHKSLNIKLFQRQ